MLPQKWHTYGVMGDRLARWISINPNYFGVHQGPAGPQGAMTRSNLLWPKDSWPSATNAECVGPQAIAEALTPGHSGHAAFSVLVESYCLDDLDVYYYIPVI